MVVINILCINLEARESQLKIMFHIIVEQEKFGIKNFTQAFVHKI